MPATWTMRQNHVLPSRALNWTDGTGATIDFSDPGYSFSLRLINISTGTVGLLKTSEFVGAATSPNLVIGWAVGELNINPGTYRWHLTATISGQDRPYAEGNEPIVIILPAATGEAVETIDVIDGGTPSSTFDGVTADGGNP